MVRKNHFFIQFNCYSVALHGTGIRYNAPEKWASNKFLVVIGKMFSVVIASVLFVVEEIQNAYFFFKESEKIQGLAQKRKCYKDLAANEKKAVEKFYEAKIEQLDAAQKLICRESSIQVVFQLTLILYQENFQNKKFETVMIQGKRLTIDLF